MPNPVTWFQIQGDSSPELGSFYKEVFNWKMSSMPGVDGHLVEKEKDGIAGGVGPAQDGGSSQVSVYISVSDVEAHLRKVEEAGGNAVMPKTELPGDAGYIAGFIDPAGNWVGLHSPSEAAIAAAKAAASKKKTKKKAGKKKAAKKAGKKKAGKKKAGKKKAGKKKAAKKAGKKKAGKKKAGKKKAGKKKARKKAAKKK